MNETINWAWWNSSYQQCTPIVDVSLRDQIIDSLVGTITHLQREVIFYKILCVIFVFASIIYGILWVKELYKMKRQDNGRGLK